MQVASVAFVLELPDPLGRGYKIFTAHGAGIYVLHEWRILAGNSGGHRSSDRQRPPKPASRWVGQATTVRDLLLSSLRL